MTEVLDRSTSKVDLSKASVIDAHHHTQTQCMLYRVLAHMAPLCLPQQRERHHARTLRSTVGL